jgi:hypothetical protein
VNDFGVGQEVYDVDQDLAVQLKEHGMNLNVFNDIESYAGIFFSRLAENEDFFTGFAGAFGRTYEDDWSTKLFAGNSIDWPGKVARLPSNKVSASLISEYASKVDGARLENF